MGRPKKNKEVKEQKEKKERKPRKKREPKEKVKRVQIREDIVAGERTHQEMVETGLMKPPADNRNLSCWKNQYFQKIPDELKVTADTPIGTKLWSARDFYDGHRKEVYFLYKHKPIDISHIVPGVEATDSENIRKEFMYDQVCIVPSHHKAANAQSLEMVMDKIEEAKKEAKRKKKKEKK